MLTYVFPDHPGATGRSHTRDGARVWGRLGVPSGQPSGLFVVMDILSPHPVSAVKEILGETRCRPMHCWGRREHECMVATTVRVAKKNLWETRCRPMDCISKQGWLATPARGRQGGGAERVGGEGPGGAAARVRRHASVAIDHETPRPARMAPDPHVFRPPRLPVLARVVDQLVFQ